MCLFRQRSARLRPQFAKARSSFRKLSAPRGRRRYDDSADLVRNVSVTEIRELELKQGLCVPVGELGFIVIAEFERVEEIPSLRISTERIIDRVQQAVDAYDFARALEWRQREISAGGDMEIPMEIFRDGKFEVPSHSGQ